MLRTIIEKGFDVWWSECLEMWMEFFRVVGEVFLDLPFFGWVIIIVSLVIVAYEWYEWH